MRARERLLVADRPVDVRVRREVHDRIAAAHHRPDHLGILDRPLDEPDLVLDVREVLAPSGVGELVEHDDLVAAVERDAHVAGTDEARTTRDEDPHRG